MVDLQYRFIR